MAPVLTGSGVKTKPIGWEIPPSTFLSSRLDRNIVLKKINRAEPVAKLTGRGG